MVPVQRAGERLRRHAARCGVGSVIQDGGRHCQTQGRQQGRCSRDLCATLTLAQPPTHTYTHTGDKSKTAVWCQ